MKKKQKTTLPKLKGRLHLPTSHLQYLNGTKQSGLTGHVCVHQTISGQNGCLKGSVVCKT